MKISDEVTKMSLSGETNLICKIGSSKGFYLSIILFLVVQL